MSDKPNFKVPGARRDAAKLEPVAKAEPQTHQDGDQPNWIDIDPATITSPVLTRQGWIVPSEKRRG